MAGVEDVGALGPELRGGLPGPVGAAPRRPQLVAVLQRQVVVAVVHHHHRRPEQKIFLCCTEIFYETKVFVAFKNVSILTHS